MFCHSLALFDCVIPAEYVTMLAQNLALTCVTGFCLTNIIAIRQSVRSGRPTGVFGYLNLLINWIILFN